jgi:hypothetical protein
MSLNPKWVPMKWPCGPREIARVNEFSSGDAELRNSAEGWAKPEHLQMLRGTPVNCLVVDWATGSAEDKPQQLSLRPLIEAGRHLGISFVGRISTKQNFAAAVAAGREAGLEAVIVNGPASESADLPMIVALPRDQIDWSRTGPIFIASGGVWAGTNLKPTDENMDGDTAVAGPTSNPWVESNSWFSLLARTMAPGGVLWMDIDPPDSPATLAAEHYCLAVADTRACGSRWIVSLDNRMRAALLKREQGAMDGWARISETLSFFEAHSDWDAYAPMGVLGVVSDFGRDNAFTTEEVLNLLDRRQVQFAVIDRKKPLPDLEEWVKGILWLDEEAPTPEQQLQLLAFLRRGGQVIAAKYWGPSAVKPSKQDWLYGYSLYNLPEGRIAVADGGFPDPYQLARDTHLLVGRKDDFVRMYNPGATKYYSSIDHQRRTQVIHVLNYSTEVADYVTLWANARAQAARLWLPKPFTSPPVEQAPHSEGTSFDLPPLSVNCAVEIRRVV